MTAYAGKFGDDWSNFRTTKRTSTTYQHTCAVQATLKYHCTYSNVRGTVGNYDGSFGPNTEKAVKEYQARYGLNADGIVGPKTWRSFSKDTYTEALFYSTDLYLYMSNPNYFTHVTHIKVPWVGGIWRVRSHRDDWIILEY